MLYHPSALLWQFELYHGFRVPSRGIHVPYVFPACSPRVPYVFPTCSLHVATRRTHVPTRGHVFHPRSFVYTPSYYTHKKRAAPVLAAFRSDVHRVPALPCFVRIRSFRFRFLSLPPGAVAVLRVHFAPLSFDARAAVRALFLFLLVISSGFPFHWFSPPFSRRYHGGSVLFTRSWLIISSSCSAFRFVFRTYPAVYFSFLAIWAVSHLRL